MNETWTLEGSPHRFPDGASIKQNVMVTVAPCAVVLIGSDHSVLVEDGGAITAVGDAQHPIRIGSDKNEPQPGDWDEFYFAAQARRTSRFAYTTFEHGGGSTGGSAYSCLHFLHPEMDLQHVTFRACRGFGIYVDTDGRFSQSSADITVREGVVGGAENAGSIFFASPDAVSSLPAGSYGSNEVNEIFLANSSTTVTKTGTWRNPGVRYHIADNFQLRIEGASSPVLTIAPGTIVAFGSQSSIAVGWDSEGALTADGGSEGGRITFTSAASEPSPGSWRGVFIGERASRVRTKLAWATIAFASGDDGFSAGCPWNDSEDDAALTLATALPAESISHVNFTGQMPNTASILRAISPAVNYAATALQNRFTDSGSECHQSPVQVNGACPSPARCE
jgi:hypothetical protein